MREFPDSSPSLTKLIASFIRSAHLLVLMPSIADFRDIYEYNWRVLRDYCEALPKLPEGELVKDPAATHQSLKNIFQHALSVHDGWLNVTPPVSAARPPVRAKTLYEG